MNAPAAWDVIADAAIPMSDQYKAALLDFYATNPELRCELVKKYTGSYRRALPESLLYCMTEDLDWSVLAEVCMADNITDRVCLRLIARAKELSGGPRNERNKKDIQHCKRVLQNIGENIHLSGSDVFYALCAVHLESNDKYEDHIGYALRAKNCPEELLAQYAETCYASDILRNSTSPSSAVYRAYEYARHRGSADRAQDAEAAAAHCNAPVDLLTELSALSDVSVLKLVLAHSAVPPRALENMADHPNDDDVAIPARRHSNATPLVFIKAMAADKITIQSAIIDMGGQNVFEKALEESPDVARFLLSVPAVAARILQEYPHIRNRRIALAAAGVSGCIVERDGR